MSAGGGDPRGVTWSVAGFDDTTVGQVRMNAMINELRACTDPTLDVVALPRGVSLVTYDYGTAEGRGALWLATNGDRTGVIGVDGVDRPMPVSVAEDVAEVLHTYLQLPWE